MKRFLHNAFVNTKSKLYFLVHDVLALATILSVISIVLSTMPALAPYQPIFRTIEWTAVAIFTFEYVARLIVTKPWYHYSFSFFGLIDVIAIAPTYLGLGNFTFLKSARVVRIIRLLRLIRLAKIRHIRTGDIEHAGGVVALNVTIYLVLLLGTLLIFGILLYIFEASTGMFESIPTSMWWTFQVFVASPFADEPLSTVGGVLYVAARFVGYILLGALIGVVGNIMRHYLLGTKK